MSKEKSHKAKKGSVDVGTIALLFAVAWIILEDWNMSVGMIVENILNWLNPIVGYGILIFIIILIATGRVSFFKHKEREDKAEETNSKSEIKPKDDITDIALGLTLIIRAISNMSKKRDK